jgi:hypothetical protein
MPTFLSLGKHLNQQGINISNETRTYNFDQLVLGHADWCYLQDLQFLFSFWMGSVMSEFNKPTEPKTQQQFYDELRNGVIEEVAKEIERMKIFGNDTLSSFAIYIRGMKR